jgi:hypothetical protein
MTKALKPSELFGLLWRCLAIGRIDATVHVDRSALGSSLTDRHRCEVWVMLCMQVAAMPRVYLLNPRFSRITRTR